jgi:hypothetical protein
LNAPSLPEQVKRDIRGIEVRELTGLY